LVSVRQPAVSARRTAETAFWHSLRSTPRHSLRASSSPSGRCWPIASSTYGATVKDQTQRSSYWLREPRV